MSRRVPLKETDLVCLGCGNVTSLVRRVDRCKKIANNMNLFCYKCCDVTRHYEVVDVDKFMWRDSTDEMELFVKELIKNGKENSQRRTDTVFKKILKK